MATRIAAKTGNFTTAGTWLVVDSTSLSDSEAANTALTTSYQESSAFTPGAITVAGVAIKIASRAAGSPSNTITVRLAQAGSDVAGTVTTMNVSDIDACGTATNEGGWYYFNFNLAGTPTSVLLLAATAYTLSVKLSATTTAVNLYSTATTNWTRMLATTTTGAPAASDILHVMGDNLAAGTKNSYTVTMDDTSGTSYGTTTPPAAVSINKGGTMTNGVAASTTYTFKWAGLFVLYSSATLNIGTSGARIPSTSTATYTMNSGSNVDTGLDTREGCTYNAYGNNITNVSALLAANASAAATSLTTNISTGWKNGDVIGLASTTRTTGDSESKALTADAVTTALTITGITNAHSGTSPTQAELVNLTRNVVIKGTSSSLQGYILHKTTAIVHVEYVELTNLGSATASKRGIDVTTSTGSCSYTFCSFHDSTIASSIGFNVSTGSANNITYSNNVSYNIANIHCNISQSTTNTSITITNNILMKATDANASIFGFLGGLFGTITGNTAVSSGSSGSGFSLSQTNAILGTFDSNTAHSNNGNGFAIGSTSVAGGTMSNIKSWRNNSSGISFAGGIAFTVSTINLWGNNSNNVSVSGSCGVTIIGLNSNGDSTFATTNGINCGSSGFVFYLNLYNCNFSTASGILTAHTTDLNVSSVDVGYIRLNSCILAAATEVSLASLMGDSFITSQKHDQTTGLHKTWKKYGIIAIDTGTVHTGSQSMSLTPNNASNKLESSAPFGFQIAVANGATLTPAVFINKSAAYNGNQPRLILKRNDSIGVTADAVIATYASGTGSWNQISGATAAATDDGVMEFVIDCDGTAGVVYVDSFTVT